ncbi:Rhodanese-like domain-containing protein [Cokeromyces recurvatus]|uniref:Rhodanese-like domain-containing protein n=1 Tax=Cokeromyces recurvatus TaxID=90255 RepID=UPI00221FAB2F|nr:Rhodanese-like domain-containing protein [Cokeromyces recurvatus]KAI7905299.1 Rhodanese-like domain-containing protein [Cokeromyces recurvatus]
MSSSITYAEPKEVELLIRDKSKLPGRDYAIIDVRGDDYRGGNIPGAINVPANEMYDKVNNLITEYSKVPIIYFHCALSQVRGPKSARIYMETLKNLNKNCDQKVKVLRNGFEGWHAKYRKEKDLIENYDESVWLWAIEDDK